MEKKQGIGFFERYLTLWVTLCIIAGIAVGQWLPAIPQTLSKFEYANVSIPVAILIWLMIYPMMLKVDFQSVKNVSKRPKGIIVTCVTNWLIKPFTMFGIAYLFFYAIFKVFIPEDLAKEYLAGTVLLGAAPCTAMVFVWSHLTKGDAAYTLVQVAVNDLIILVAFAPIVALLLGVGGVTIPWDTLFLSVLLFVVIPLSAGVITRTWVIRRKGIEYFNHVFIRKFDNYTVGGLLLTLIILFSFQGETILNTPLHILLIAVPLVLQTILIFFVAYGWAKWWKLPHNVKSSPPRHSPNGSGRRSRDTSGADAGGSFRRIGGMRRPPPSPKYISEPSRPPSSFPVAGRRSSCPSSVPLHQGIRRGRRP